MIKETEIMVMTEFKADISSQLLLNKIDEYKRFEEEQEIFTDYVNYTDLVHIIHSLIK